MELKEELIEKVERYLSGKLTREEVKEDSLSDISDEELDESVQLFETSKSLIELDGLREDLRSIHSEYIADTQISKRSTRWVWITAAMAAVIICFVLFTGLLKDHPPTFEEYFIPYPDILSMRGNELDLGEAMRFYSGQNYEAALREFSAIQSDVPNVAILFYQGVSALAVGNYDLATSNFEQLTDLERNTYWQQTTWFLALTYWQKGNIEKTRQLLTSIKEGQYGYEESREILEAL